MGEVYSLLGFLGKEKWPELYKQSNKYFTSQQPAAPLIQDVKHDFLFDVIISIVKIVSFFCAASRKPKCCSAGVIEKVNDALNNSNREDILFDLLSTNSIDVKLAVVDCLNNVPLNQFSSDEMQRMVTLIKVNKTAVGKGMIVLGKIIWIVSKLSKDQEDKVGVIFRKHYAKKTIKLVLDILLDIRLSTCSKEEIQYHEFLALSCVHFLQCCSMTKELDQYISTFSGPFCSIIKEDENIHKRIPNAPSLGVEETGMGNSTTSILTLFTTAAVLNPYSDVCLRALQALSRIFSGSNDYDVPLVFPDELAEQSSEPIREQSPIELIRTRLKAKEDKRKLNEDAMWEDIAANKKLNVKKEMIDSINSNVKIFVDSYMIDILLNFFLGTGANSSHPEMAKYIENFSQGKFNTKSLIPELKEEVEKAKKEFLNNGKAEPSAKSKEENKDSNPKMAEDLIVQDLEKEPLRYNGKFLENMSSRGLSVNISEKIIIEDSQEAEVLHKKVEQIQPYENIKNRALIASALIRCIYNAFAYCPEAREAILKQLRVKKTLKGLTQLCFSTGWIEGNVGIKYLLLCKYILKVNANESFAELYRISLDQLVCSAFCDMIGLMDNKIKSERKVPFMERENNLVIQLSSFIIYVINQAKYINYLDIDNYSEDQQESEETIEKPVKPKKEETKQKSEEQLAFENYFYNIQDIKVHGEMKPTPKSKCTAICVKAFLPMHTLKTIITFIFFLHRKIIQVRNTIINGKQNNKFLYTLEMVIIRIIIALASYMSICPEHKYTVLENIMSEATLSKQYFRRSCVQVILNWWQKQFISNAIVFFW